ncbi:MAG: hypothetical protein JST90_19790 [Bacteroidetes bacterium]|nr:hypothetical protein [Bacteroidota bacterium]
MAAILKTFLELLKFLKNVAKYPPVLSTTALLLYFIYTDIHSYLNKIELLLTIIAGLLMATFVLGTIEVKSKRIFGHACLTSGLLFFTLALYMGFCKFEAADGKIHLRGLIYKHDANVWIQTHPDETQPEIIIRKFHYDENQVWEDITATKILLLVLNLLVFGTLWVALRVEIEIKKPARQRSPRPSGVVLRK